MNHISLFNTEEEYKDVKYSLPVPNVSYIKDIDKVEFMKVHAIDFGEDNVAKNICVSLWDTDGDGEFTIEEAASVTAISSEAVSAFSTSKITDGMFVKYLTGISSLPAMFANATQLTRLAIPKNVTKITGDIFENASALKDLYLYWTTMPVATDLSRYFTKGKMQHVYIPKGTKSKYLANARLKEFGAKLIELDKMP